MSVSSFDADRYTIEQLIRPIANLYKVSADGRPVAFVRQKKLAIKEDLRFFADEGETRELFRIKARSVFEVRGTYDVTDAMDGPIGALQKDFVTSLARSTWNVLDPAAAVVARATEQNLVVAIVRRVVDLPLPFHFDFRDEATGVVVLSSQKRFGLRDRYSIDVPDPRVDFRLAASIAVALDALLAR